MLIRKIHNEDANDIAQLTSQLGYSFPSEKTVVQIDAINNSINDAAYVAIDNNKIVGWIHVYYAVRLECEFFCEIGGLVIDEQYRGTGVGKMLIEYIKPWCLDKKCSLIRVRCNIKRAEAHRFYGHLGFTERKQQKVFELAI